MRAFLTLAGLSGAAAGGYLLGRRGDEVRVAVGRALHRAHGERRTEISLSVTSRPSFDTEFDHVAEHEHDERHRLAEEIKGAPLHERERRARARRQHADELAGWTTQPLGRDRDDLIAPRTL